MRRRKIDIKLPYIIMPSVIFVDQVSKWFALENLTTVCNKGYGFGLLPNFFNEIVVIFVLLLVVYAFRLSSLRLRRIEQYIAYSLVVGGGLSNLIDRVARGCVVDFIDLKIWPAFNLADSAITMGVFLIIYTLIFHPKPIR